MIDGVTVLASGVVTTSCVIINIMFYTFLGLLVLGFLSLLVGLIADSLGFVQTGVIMISCSFILFLISLPIDAVTQIPDYTKYEVILDDSVSMNEFMNTYEVLEQRGQIYVIKEIEE
jgi:Zn-dependent membrane protease YugP